MDVYKVLEIIYSVCYKYNKPIKNICISNSSLLVNLENNSNFTLYYRNMTEKDIERLVATCCKLSSNILN